MISISTASRFTVAPTAVGGIPYPVGVGILLFGSRGTVVEDNKIYGNYLTGLGMIQALTLKNPKDQTLLDNTVRKNEFGAGGADKNGRDISYDGDGQNNCFSDNTGVEVFFPADPAVFPACPFKGANKLSSPAQVEAINWTINDPSHEKYWVKHPHAPKAGYTPLEHHTK
mgnify:CR=1 FL=1